MRAIWVTVLSDLRRRLVQTVLIGLVVLLSAGTWTLALNLLAESSNPWEQAFAQQQGAHLTATFDSTKVSADQLGGTREAIAAASSAGPWPQAGVTFALGATKYYLTVVGRADAGGPVDVLTLTSGRWVQGPGEIVLTRAFAERTGIGVGDRLRDLMRADRAAYRVVGEVVDVNEPPAASPGTTAWVEPGEVAPLQPQPVSLVMAYRFAQDPGQERLGQALDELRSAVPAGALTQSSSYLVTRQVVNGANSVTVTFVIAFAVLMIAAAAAIVGNVVAGVVLVSYRQVGIMKAVGFSPWHVVEVYTGQMLLIGLVGCVLGIPAGMAVSAPLLEQNAHALGVPAPPVVLPWVAAAVLLGILMIVGLAAFAPALRAGLLNTVRAITLGTAPQRGSGSRLARAMAAVGAPRSVSLGAGQAFIRPLRGGLTALGILVGVATVTFSIGLTGTIWHMIEGSPLTDVQVEVDRIGSYPDRQVMDTLQAQPETDAVVAHYQTRVVVPGVADFVNAFALRGDPTRIGYAVTSGRWYQQPGEAVVSPGLLHAAHLGLGDSLSTSVDGHPVRLTIVGTFLERLNVSHEIYFDWSTYTQAVPDGVPSYYFVRLRPGASVAQYVQRVQQTEPDLLNVYPFGIGSGLSPVMLLNALVAGLAVLLGLVAAIGVFSTVLLNTRERARETAIFKALGMTPGQVLVMTVAGACLLGLAGGVLGLPAGVALHRVALQFATASTGQEFPPSTTNVFTPGVFPLLAVGAVAVAALGALLPALWASRTRVIGVLHAE